MVLATKDYREILIEEYSRRRLRNPAYSLRAFARDLDVTYSRLNEALNKKTGLSAKQAEKIATKLGFTKKEKEIFVTQILSQHARSKVEKRVASEKLQDFSKDLKGKALDAQTFEILSNWYNYSILELTRLPNFKYDIQWISKKLGITETEAKNAIAKLIKIGMLKKEGQTVRADSEFYFSSDGIPSTGLKTYHEQNLERAKQALFLQAVDQRDFSSITMAVDKDNIPQVAQLIKKFRRDLSNLLESTENKNSIYMISIQYFRQDKDI